MSYLLNGTSEYFHATAPATAAPLTISIWAKEASTSQQGLLTLARSSGMEEAFLAQTRSSGVHRAAVIINGSATNIDSIGSWTADAWHHYVLRIVSTTSRYSYFDGGNASAESTTSLAPSSIDTLGIGCRKPLNTPSTFFSGYIAEAAVFDEALSPADISDLYAGKNPQDFASLVGYWPLEDDTSAVIGGTLTTVGSPTQDADHPTIDAPTGGGSPVIPAILRHHLNLLNPA